MSRPSKKTSINGFSLMRIFFVDDSKKSGQGRPFDHEINHLVSSYWNVSARIIQYAYFSLIINLIIYHVFFYSKLFKVLKPDLKEEWKRLANEHKHKNMTELKNLLNDPVAIRLFDESKQLVVEYVTCYKNINMEFSLL